MRHLWIFMVIYVTISVPAIHFVVSLSEKRRVACRETTFLDTIFYTQLFLCETPTPRIGILSEKPLNTIYSARVGVVSTLPLTLPPTLPHETLGISWYRKIFFTLYRGSFATFKCSNCALTRKKYFLRQSALFSWLRRKKPRLTGFEFIWHKISGLVFPDILRGGCRVECWVGCLG